MTTTQTNTKDQTNNRSVELSNAKAPRMTKVQALARHAARATFDDLSPESPKQSKEVLYLTAHRQNTIDRVSMYPA